MRKIWATRSALFVVARGLFRDREEITWTVLEEKTGSDFEDFSEGSIPHTSEEKSSIDESDFPSRTVYDISLRSLITRSALFVAARGLFVTRSALFVARSKARERSEDEPQLRVRIMKRILTAVAVLLFFVPSVPSVLFRCFTELHGQDDKDLIAITSLPSRVSRFNRRNHRLFSVTDRKKHISTLQKNNQLFRFTHKLKWCF